MLNEATLAFAERHADDDVRRLALQPVPDPAVNLTAALQQIEGRQLARRKLPGWAACPGMIFPPRLSMEQCSSEATARYKQEIVKRLFGKAADTALLQGTFADLTGGFGVDFSYLAPLFNRAVYVERLPHLCRIARHNLDCLGLQRAEIINSDATEYLPTLPAADLLFMDPARRDGSGRKTVAIADCEPNLEILQPLLREKGRFTLIKLSPMLDIGLALQRLPGISQVHVVSVAGECKELLLVMPQTPSGSVPSIHCVNLTDKSTALPFVFTLEEEAATSCTYTTALKKYLYEPNASLLKAQAQRITAVRFGLEKLHPNSHLYTSDRLLTDFPGRMFRIEAASGFGKKESRDLLKNLSKANLTVRNFPASAADLRKRLRLTDGGDIYLFATTTADGKHILIRCSKPS